MAFHWLDINTVCCSNKGFHSLPLVQYIMLIMHASGRTIAATMGWSLL